MVICLSATWQGGDNAFACHIAKRCRLRAPRFVAGDGSGTLNPCGCAKRWDDVEVQLNWDDFVRRV